MRHAERLTVLLACLCALSGCARSAVEAFADAGGGTGGPMGPVDAGGDDDAMMPPVDAGTNAPKDSGMPPAKPDAGMMMPDASSTQCTDPQVTCASAMMLGSIDASDSAAKIMHQGKGSGWFAVDLNDGNMNAMGNIRIGVGVKLTQPAGATYSVTLMGDTSPGSGGRCIAADVTDTDPLDKTASWGSFGPTAATKRQMAIHVEHLSGPCDADWTLTVSGNPCPDLNFGFGEDSMGSCP